MVFSFVTIQTHRPRSGLTPHRFACGLPPLPHRLPLKGGVTFIFAVIP